MYVFEGIWSSSSTLDNLRVAAIGSSSAIGNYFRFLFDALSHKPRLVATAELINIVVYPTKNSHAIFCQKSKINAKITT